MCPSFPPGAKRLARSQRQIVSNGCVGTARFPASLSLVCVIVWHAEPGYVLLTSVQSLDLPVTEGSLASALRASPVPPPPGRDPFWRPVTEMALILAHHASGAQVGR